MTRPGFIAARGAFYPVGAAIVGILEGIIEHAVALVLGMRAMLLIDDSLSYHDECDKEMVWCTYARPVPVLIFFTSNRF